jgi:CheY-like chemotaxis protein
MLMDLAHKKGFKALVALRGDKGLALAKEIKPDAITLDIRLPDMAGWMVLNRLKYDPETRHIPVHVISMDEDYRRGLSMGAETYLEKSDDTGALMETFDKIQSSVHPGVRQMLIVDPDEARREETIEVIGENADLITTFASTAEEALRAAEGKDFDCAVINSELPDMSVPELIEKFQKQAGRSELPIIVYPADPPTPELEVELKRAAETAIVKVVRSKERLLEETAIFLNRKEEELSEDQKRMLDDARHRDTMLAGGKILIVDDDVRNIFALTSGLERHKLQVLHAESGRAGIEVLKKNPDIDLVLMDIMMPEMDGYETTRAIRQLKQFRSLPIIALTAKAMKGDREKCIEAGTSDYIAKPVVLDELIDLLRLWLPQTHDHAMAGALEQAGDA